MSRPDFQIIFGSKENPDLYLGNMKNQAKIVQEIFMASRASDISQGEA